MNPIYGQTLKTLKVSAPQEIPPFESNLHAIIKEDLKSLATQISQLGKINTALQTELSGITSQQIANLPQNVQKRDRHNFSKTKLAIIIDSYYRIKRFMLIYNHTRLNKLEQQFWSFSGNLHEEVKKNLSQNEKTYFKDYKDITTQYIESVGLELTLDLDPPIDSSVEVKFLKDCGEILSDDGYPLKLEKNTVLFTKKRLIENFIKNGSAQIISSSSH